MLVLFRVRVERRLVALEPYTTLDSRAGCTGLGRSGNLVSSCLSSREPSKPFSRISTVDWHIRGLPDETSCE
jgi:hypothetical protein